jgi:hypothetical protein
LSLSSLLFEFDILVNFKIENRLIWIIIYYENCVNLKYGYTNKIMEIKQYFLEILAFDF